METVEKSANPRILKRLYKCPLMRRSVAVNLFAIGPSAASTAQQPPILHKLLKGVEGGGWRVKRGETPEQVAAVLGISQMMIMTKAEARMTKE
jgi:hypothetical protein